MLLQFPWRNIFLGRKLGCLSSKHLTYPSIKLDWEGLNYGILTNAQTQSCFYLLTQTNWSSSQFVALYNAICTTGTLAVIRLYYWDCIVRYVLVWLYCWDCVTVALLLGIYYWDCITVTVSLGMYYLDCNTGSVLLWLSPDWVNPSVLLAVPPASYWLAGWVSQSQPCPFSPLLAPSWPLSHVI